LPKDFIAYRLTGACVTDTGDASGTLLFDIDRRCWNSAMVERFDIDPSRLPNAVESAQTIGTVSTWAASQTGLRAGTPVAAGSGDNMTAAIGAGVTRTGQVLAVLGTSGVILAGADAPHRDLGNGGPPGRLQTMAAATGAHAWC